MAPEQPGLWDDSPGKYGESPYEASIRAQIDAMHAETPFTTVQRGHAATCMMLARNIHLGNSKGRAIANEAAQLTTLLNQLAGLDAEGLDTQGSAVDAEIQRMMDAFQAPGAHGAHPAAPRHHAA